VKDINPTLQRSATVVLLVLALCAAFVSMHSDALATPPSAMPAAQTSARAPKPKVTTATDAGAAQGAAAAKPKPSEGEAEATEPTPPAHDPNEVWIQFTTTPPVAAVVLWGKTRLGLIKPRKPLVVVRPRDSGPLDVSVRARGYLPVQTRAHTFSDSRMMVKMTPESQKSTLLGYRAPLDAGAPLGPDGGVPEDLASGMPPSLTSPSLAPTTGAQTPTPSSSPPPTASPAPATP